MSVLDAALGYIQRGFAVVPVPYRKKGPIIEAWQTLRITAEDAPRYFNGQPQNIGIILGQASGGVTDIDIDCPEAISAAPYLLPKTAIFGHTAKRASHWIYRTDIAKTADRAAIKFMSADKTGLLEVRMGGGGRGGQTVFPPSTHTSGEPIVWEGGAAIREIDGALLLRRASILAAAAQLAHAYPPNGGRHDGAFVLGGFLSRCGFTPTEISPFVEAVAVASGQPLDKRRDMIRTAKDAAVGTKPAGFPLLMQTFGRDVAEKCAAWLGYRGTADNRGEEEHSAAEISVQDFHAYMPTHSYIFTPSREMWPAASVNSRIAQIKIDDSDGKAVSVSAWLDKNKPVEQMTWAPGKPMLIKDRLIADGGWIDRNGVSCFNLYRPPIVKPGDPTQAGLWIDHINIVYPNDAAHIINWLAQRVQHPEEKINHALVLGGKQGIGKDTLLEPVKTAVGPWNFAEVKPTQIMNRFNGFLKSVILRVSEARDLGEVNRYQFYDHTKDYIASPPDVLRVDEKHLREHAILNCTGVIITSNQKTDGIYLPSDDRRHYVAWSDLSKEDFDDGYWCTLWNWYNREGNGHVAAHLRDIDISEFDPKAPPPKTLAFWDIVDANRAPEDAELADVIDELRNPAAFTLVMLQSTACGKPIFDWLSDRKNRRAIPYRLEACEYTPVRNDGAKSGLWVVRGTRQVVYARQELSIRDRIAAANNLTG